MIKKLLMVLMLLGPAMVAAEEGYDDDAADCREEAMNSGITDPHEMREYIDQCIEDYRAQRESADEEPTTYDPEM